MTAPNRGPLDARVREQVYVARGALVVLVLAALTGGALVIGQAFAVTALVVGAVRGGFSDQAALALVLVTLGRVGAAYVVDVAAAHAAGLVATSLRTRLLGSLAASVRPGSPGRGTGALTVLLTRGVAATEPWFTRYLPALVVAGAVPIATLVVIALLDPWSALIVALTLPLLPVFAVLIGVSTRDRAERQWRRLGALSGHFVDVMRGLPTLIAHRRARAQVQVIREVTHRYRRATLDTVRLAFASSAVLELLATLSVALVAVCVGLRLAAGGLDLSTALTVLLLAPEAYWPIRRVGAEFHAAAEGSAAFADADEVLRAPGPAVVATSGPPLEVRDLWAGYPGRSVLRGVTARFDRGLTAITGPSGCGKSTLLAVLLGEVRPDRGTASVAAAPAYVSQRPWLVPGTVAENLRMGRPDATDAELWWALERLDLAHSVLARHAGLHSALGEEGLGLSAGERARLAMARVLVSQRRVVLLDEPTAHLDAATEAVLLDVVRDLARTRTVVVVAHRAAVIEAADHVVTLDPPLVEPAPLVEARIEEPRDEASRDPVSHPPTPPQYGSTLDPPGLVTRPARPSRSAPRPGSESTQAAAIGIALGALSVAAGVALTATSGWLITRAAAHPPVLTLMVAIVGVRAFGLARPALRYAERLASHDSALRALAERRAEVFAALIPLGPGHLGRRRGDVLAAVVDDVDGLVDRQLRVRQPLWTAALVGLGTAGAAALVIPPAGAVVLAMVAVAALAAAAVHAVARRVEPGFVADRAALAATVEETLHSARHLVVWSRLDDAVGSARRASAELARRQRRSARATALGRAAVLAAGGGAMIAIAALAAGATSPALTALLVLLPLALTEALLPAIDAAVVAARCRAADRRLRDLLHASPAVCEPTDPQPISEHPSVETPHFVLAHGERVGVVGPSGSGKTTLAHRLLRHVEPAPGERYAYDGVNVRALAADDVRCRVALLDDDPYAFASSVLENVRLARPTASDQEVLDAVRAARLGDWLDALPHGVRTVIGEGGADVSGGERARLGLARMLLADRPVVVLDEPTAHLDTATARAVVADVLGATDGRTVVWITHLPDELPARLPLVDLTSSGPSPVTTSALVPRVRSS